MMQKIAQIFSAIYAAFNLALAENAGHNNRTICGE
jgi:hypothetical protein